MKRLFCVLLLALMILPAAAETVQDQALAFMQAAGIAADSVTRIENEIIISLPSGGTATLHLPGDFDRYDLGWRFENASDEEVAAYLDHALSLLLTVERKIPADTENLTAMQKIRVNSQIALVANGLVDLEATGEQGLRILQEKLAAHDDSELNDLRARLVSRMLEAAEDPADGPADGESGR